MRVTTLATLMLALSSAAGAEQVTTELAEATEAAASIVDSARLYVPARAVERTPPSYPRTALSNGREAWIYVAYCIDETGKPQNISVLDAAGNQQFERAAVDSIKQWRFEPALVNGEPSWQSRNQQYITFAIESDRRGATRRFISKYKKLSKLIDENKLEEADALFNKLLAGDNLNLYELGRLWEQRVRYEFKTGDMLRLDLALRRASASDGAWIEPETYHYLLALRVKVQTQLGHYPAARTSYETLVEAAGENATAVQELVPLMDQLAEIVNSGSVLKIEGEVRERGGCHGCDDSYVFTPEHRALAFQNINGALNSIVMRCDHRHFESDISDLVEWHIPENWGSCDLEVRGEPGTTFDILMAPDA